MTNFEGCIMNCQKPIALSKVYILNLDLGTELTIFYHILILCRHY